MAFTNQLQREATIARSVVIVFGPPLPGRNSLARALAQRLPSAQRMRASEGRFPTARVTAALREGRLPVVEGDFVGATERAAARRAVATAGGHALFVAWLCDPEEARREIYRRYARLPTRFADGWWEGWQTDFCRRQPLGSEIPSAELVTVGARGSLLDHVVRVESRLGLPAPAGASGREQLRVLVVDDEEDARELVAQTLESAGCEVLRACDAEEALRIAIEEPLDLVITDQQMPGHSGTELAERLAVVRPDVKIALLTGYAEETVEEARQAHGVGVLLAKPASGSDLLRLLEEMT